MTRPKTPPGLKTGGKRLWRQVQEDFELGTHEESVLLQACRIADVLDQLQSLIDTQPVLLQSPQGVKTNPAVVEFRQQALTLARLMASLRIPMGEEESTGRLPQQRVGVRGPRRLEAL